jgi:hypothetical protein
VTQLFYGAITEGTLSSVKLSSGLSIKVADVEIISRDVSSSATHSENGPLFGYAPAFRKINSQPLLDSQKL